MIRHTTVAALTLGVLAGTLTAPALTANADDADQLVEVGDLHAYVTQPQGCDAGGVHIIAAPGASYWTVDGERLYVGSPQRRIAYPEGAQVSLHALPDDGYFIRDDVRGSAALPFELQVMPVPAECYDLPTCKPSGEAVDRLRARVHRLRERVARLRDRLGR